MINSLIEFNNTVEFQKKSAQLKKRFFSCDLRDIFFQIFFQNGGEQEKGG